MLARIDLNSDMGESDASEIQVVEAAMMPLITSVSIACGGHAGTPDSMRRTARLAVRHGVAIGAHPGLVDKQHFGRVEAPLTEQAVIDLIGQQVVALSRVLAEEGLRPAHVKPHGALYNMAARDPQVAWAVVQGVLAVDRSLRLFALAGSELVKAGSLASLVVVQEAFADRAYRADGTLAPRSESGALLTNEQEVRRQVRGIVSGRIASVEGTPVSIQADSLCLHSDTPEAVRLARAVRNELESAGVRLDSTRDRSA